MNFNQGDIIKFNFDPTLGHEQEGYRPAVVISRKMFHEKTGQLIVCPITNRSRPYPTRVPLCGENETRGFVICDHIKTIDAAARKPVYVERISENALDKVLAIVCSEIAKDSKFI